jgi:glycosyltransferase involved in cell wall biosynthesis
MAHILYHFAHSVFGGVERYGHSIIEGLHGRGHKISILAPPGLMQAGMQEAVGHLIEAVYELPASTQARLATITKTLWQVKPDIFHVIDYDFVAPFVPFAWPNTRLFMTVHTPAVRYAHNKKAELLRAAMVKLPFTTMVLSDENRVRAHENYGFHFNNLKTVCLGLPESRFNFETSKAQCREDHDLPSDKILIGTVCRLATQKRLERMLSLAERLKDLKNIQFVIAGYGECETELKALAKQKSLENILKFQGTVSPPEPFVKTLDIFLMTSDFEGLPASGIEAFAMGVPLVGSRVPGILDLVGQSQAAALFEPDDLDTAEQILRDWIADPELLKKRSKLARELYLEKYTLTTMLDRLEAVYSDS